MTGALLWMTLCAFANAWRGSGSGPWNPAGWSSTIQRIALSGLLALPAIVADPLLGGIMALLIYCPGFCLGWGGYFDFGTGRGPGSEQGASDVEFIDKLWHKIPGTEARRDFVALSIRGLLFTVPAAGVGCIANPLVLLLAPLGALMGPTYWYARKLWKGDYIKAAELAWGAILGALFFDMGLMMGLVS